MPRGGAYTINEYVEVMNGISLCKMCNGKFRSNRKHNLKTHLENVHKISIGVKVQKYKTKKIKCDISKKLLIKSYIGLVTDESASFNLLNSDHMRNILDPICKGIERESGNTFCLNAGSCKKALSEVARNIIKAITSECEKKIVSLKVDSATISAQFIKNDKIVSRTLGMIASKGVHSSSAIDLATEILNVISKYKISLQQIVSITTDNASNSLRTFKLLPRLFAREYEDNELEHNYDNEAYFQNIELIEKNSVLRERDIVINTCAAQVTQLVALETSKNSKIKKYIRNCRNLVKFLRRNRHGFTDFFTTLKIPQLDCPTRWGSTYSMIYDIKSAKDLVESVKSVTNKSIEENFEVNEDFWNFVDAYCLALIPLQKTIVNFQKEQLHYGDFYAKWLQCQLITQKKVDENTPNKNSLLYKINCVLLESMTNQTKTLFSNHALAACLYLDPKFHHMLQDTQKKEAIEYLKELWVKFTKVHTKDISAPITNEIIKAEIDDEDGDDDDDGDGDGDDDGDGDGDGDCEGEDEEDDILGAFLDKKFYSSNTKNDDDITTKIERLKIPYSKHITNVLSFWKERKYTDPELYALSNICFGIPATQVSGKFSLSSLKRLISDNSDCVEEDTLENILLIKLNPDFMDKATSELDLVFSKDDSADE